MKRDRYAIYEMMGKMVNFRLPRARTNKPVEGVVDSVYRDVVNKQIEIEIGQVRYVFREPDSVIYLEEDASLVFVYGDEEDPTDEEFFEALKTASGKGSGVDAALRELEREKQHIFFSLFAAPPRNTRRNRGRGSSGRARNIGASKTARKDKKRKESNQRKGKQNG